MKEAKTHTGFLLRCGTICPTFKLFSFFFKSKGKVDAAQLNVTTGSRWSSEQNWWPRMLHGCIVNTSWGFEKDLACADVILSVSCFSTVFKVQQSGVQALVTPYVAAKKQCYFCLLNLTGYSNGSNISNLFQLCLLLQGNVRMLFFRCVVKERQQPKETCLFATACRVFVNISKETSLEWGSADAHCLTTGCYVFPFAES